MRKVRDYDAELKALGDKARALKARKIEQLGQLVTLTGADALDSEILAGALLDAAAAADTGTREAWRAKGAAFFHGRRRKAGAPAPRNLLDAASAAPGDAAGGSSGATQR